MFARHTKKYIQVSFDIFWPFDICSLIFVPADINDRGHLKPDRSERTSPLLTLCRLFPPTITISDRSQIILAPLPPPPL